VSFAPLFVFFAFEIRHEKKTKRRDGREEGPYLAIPLRGKPRASPILPPAAALGRPRD
jgi:hypothetical protein